MGPNNQDRLRKVETIQSIQQDRVAWLENKVSELEQNLSVTLEMVSAMAMANRMLADQEETRREVEQN